MLAANALCHETLHEVEVLLRVAVLQQQQDGAQGQPTTQQTVQPSQARGYEDLTMQPGSCAKIKRGSAACSTRLPAYEGAHAAGTTCWCRTSIAQALENSI
jgi:hypothetical protein